MSGREDNTPTPDDAPRRLHELRLSTYNPSKYVLTNEEDGTVWRGSITGWNPANLPAEAPRCVYQPSWRSRCANLAEVDRVVCALHMSELCSVVGCDQQAISECSHTMQFVCGFRRCEQHKDEPHWGH